MVAVGEEHGGRRCGGEPDRAVAVEHRDFEVAFGRGGDGGQPGLGELAFPVVERGFPVRALLRVELGEQVADSLEAGQIEVGLEEVVAHLEPVELGTKMRFGEGEELREVRGVAEVAAHLGEQVGGRGRAGHGERITVQAEGFVELAAVEGLLCEPEPSAPAVG